MAAETIRPAPHRIGVAGAILLIAASAALGAYYGFTVGSHAHWSIGVVFAGAALGGELLKPFAVVHTLAALRAREILHGLACAVLAVVCVAYSVSSELSLAAGSRGDLASERRQSVELVEAVRDRRARAIAELQALPPARSASEIEPLIAKLSTVRGTNGCERRAANAEAREACAKVADLRAEAARDAKRRELERRIASADAELASAPVAVADADPLASALAAYAKSLGADVSADTLSPWLALIPVLFLEFGSALSLVVLRPIAEPTPTTASPLASRRPAEGATAVSESGPLPVPPTERPAVLEPIAGVRAISSEPDAQLSERVIELLQNKGGRTFGGQRQLASALGISKSRMNELLHAMAQRGRIALETSHRGTAIALLN